jgi:hypothetical protein
MDWLSIIKVHLLKISPDVAGSVIGGIIVAILTPVCIYIARRLRHWRFKRIFGPDAHKKGKYHIVYAKLALDKDLIGDGNRRDYPYSKQARPSRHSSTGGIFSMQNPVSSCEFRAAKYLASLFGLYTGTQPELTSDNDIDSKLDLSYVSLGGPLSNWKTDDALNNSSNPFSRMTERNFLSSTSERQVLDFESGFDYGLILRIRPEEFRNRIWIVCAGIEESGTSGAAWYLSNKWKEILSHNRPWWAPPGFGESTDFAAIIRVKPGQDESARLIKHFKKPEEVELSAEELHSIRTAQDTTAVSTSNVSAESHFTPPGSVD